MMTLEISQENKQDASEIQVASYVQKAWGPRYRPKKKKQPPCDESVIQHLD